MGQQDTPISRFPTHECQQGQHARCSGWTAGLYVARLCGCLDPGCGCRSRATPEARPQLWETYSYVKASR